MSGLFGKKTQSTSDVRYNSIQLNQSSYGNPMPLVYGQTRVPMNLGWYGDFVSTPHTQQSGGGKGGGGGSGNTTYSYSAAMVMMLAEGQVSAIGTIWADKALHTLSDLGLTLFVGTGGQTAWSFLTTNHLSQAIPYDHIAYVAHASFQLGSSAGLPNLSFELTGLVPYGIGGINDAEASAMLTDYLTEANHGAGFPFLGTFATAGATTYQNYCYAMSFFLSPAELTQRKASDFLDEILQITNSAAVWSAGVLNIIPYADAAVTGNSRTYTPNMTPLFAFGDSDYIADNADPVIVSRKPLSDTYNRVRVEFLDRANSYNTSIAEATDALDIAINGERCMATLSFHSITTSALARQVAQLILQRNLYIRNSFTFSVRADYSLLEAMDLISLSDSGLGLVNQLVRITDITDDENDVLTITGEEVPIGPASAPIYNWQAAAGYAANYNSAPGAVQTPLIFMLPALLVDPAGGGYEIACAVAGNSANWGGCDVYMSLDNSTYVYVGSIYGPARYGTLTSTFASGSDPDTTNALQVLLANTALQLTAGSQADADNLRTLMWVDGEIVGYQYCTLTAPGAYTFTSTGLVGGTKYMRRGQYGSSIASHASGQPFARIDAALFRVVTDPGFINQPVYFKFPSFNIYGGGIQTLAAATAYSYTPQSANIGQSTPGSVRLIARGNCVVVGDRIFKSGGASAFDSDCYSQESYYNGCALSFRAAQTNLTFIMGLNTDPTTDQNYTSLDFCWGADSSGLAFIYESGTGLGSFGAYTTSTVFSITYDGNMVRYFLDGVLKRSSILVGATFFLDSSFGNPGVQAQDVRFGPSPPVTPPQFSLIPRGNCQTTGRMIQKVGGVVGTPSDCYSSEGIQGACFVRFRAAQTNLEFFVGLNTDPTTDQAYTSLDYAWQCFSDGTCHIYESGGFGTGFGSYTTATLLEIRHDGIGQVTYLKDGLIVRVVPAPVGIYYFDSAFYGVGGIAQNVEFGSLGEAGSPDSSPVFLDTFDHQSLESRYRIISAGTFTYPANGLNGGRVLHAVNASTFVGLENIPFDPNVTYRITARARQTTADSLGTRDLIYLGVEGVAADGVTLLNVTGTNSDSSQHYYGAAGFDLGAAGIGTWVDFIGYFRGTSGSPAGAPPTIVDTPGALYTGTKYIRPIVYMNYNGGDGAQELDFIKIERLIVPDDSDNTNKKRMAPDAEFALAVDATYWYTGSTDGSTPWTLSLTGGVIGGKASVTANSHEHFLATRRNPAFKVSINQAFGVPLRWRRTGTITGTGNLSAFLLRHGQDPSGTFDPTSGYLQPGGVNLTVAEMNARTVNVWQEDTGIALTVISPATGNPVYASLVIEVPTTITGGTIEVDYADAVLGTTGLPQKRTYTATATLTMADMMMALTYDSTSAGTFTLPSFAGGIVPIGARIYVEQANTGALTIAPAAGYTLSSSPNTSGNRTLSGRYAKAVIEYKDVGSWYIYGQLA